MNNNDIELNLLFLNHGIASYADISINMNSKEEITSLQTFINRNPTSKIKYAEFCRTNYDDATLDAI